MKLEEIRSRPIPSEALVFKSNTLFLLYSVLLLCRISECSATTPAKSGLFINSESLIQYPAVDHSIRVSDNPASFRQYSLYLQS